LSDVRSSRRTGSRIEYISNFVRFPDIIPLKQAEMVSQRRVQDVCTERANKINLGPVSRSRKKIPAPRSSACTRLPQLQVAELNRKAIAYLPGLASSIPVRSCPANGLLSFEENHSPSFSSSRTFGEQQATDRLHGDHGCRCGIHVEW
jgi:hypothetical protein